MRNSEIVIISEEPHDFLVEFIILVIQHVAQGRPRLQWENPVWTHNLCHNSGLAINVHI